MSKSLFALIDELLRLPRLDHESAEKVIGLPLISSNEQDPYLVTYHGLTKEASAEVIEVELRCPGPSSKMKDGLIILSVSPDLELTIDEVRERFGEEGSYNPRPAESPSSTPNYTSYRRKKTRLSFGFLEPTQRSCSTWPGNLVTVVIDRSNN